MTKILLTGSNGYIAKSFVTLTSHTKNVDLISLRNNDWRGFSFSGYDVVIHTAGIAHQKETPSNQQEYYSINRDLSFEVARKAKNEGVKQFIFLSSISVYGLVRGTITKDTKTKPTTHYGRSKLEAEGLITSLASDTFKVTILRPPMVYGQDCPGNYSKLYKLVKMTPIFPNYPNARSLIYINNLCAFIDDVIKGEKDGLFLPYDPAISTTQMVMDIADKEGKTIKFTKVFNWIITILMPLPIVSKLFGSLTIKPHH